LLTQAQGMFLHGVSARFACSYSVSGGPAARRAQCRLRV